MTKRSKKAIFINLVVLLVIFCGVLKFADEILMVKRALYQMVKPPQEEPLSDLQLMFVDYEPLTHTGDEWYQKTKLIYHAGGGIDGLSYTNSKEALELTLNQKNYMIELDFLFTTDGHLICGHEWTDLYSIEALSLAEVQELGFYRKYTPLKGEDVISYMRDYPQMYLVVDTKEAEPVEVIRELVRLAEGDESLLNRFVIQLYDRGMKAQVLQIYPFPSENFLFTAYQFGCERVTDILQICLEERIPVATVGFWVWTDEEVNLFREKGIIVFEHTINEVSEAEIALHRGIQGLYTDFLQPYDLPLEWDLNQVTKDYEPFVHTGNEWYFDTRLVYNAGGGIDGVTQSNSREAVENVLSQENYVLELDFLFTSDGHLICGNEWKNFYSLEPLSWEEIQKTKYYRKYHPLTAAEVISYMQEYPQLRVIVDTKEVLPKSVYQELVRLAQEDVEILNRMVIQVSDPKLKNEVLEIYPFPNENILFQTDEFGPDRVEEILTLCFEEDIRVVTVVFHAWEDEVLALCQEKGIVVFEHTVNDAADARGTIARGVQGVYTDFLQPADLLPCEE